MKSIKKHYNINNNNIVQIPILKSLGNKNEEKLTFDKLLNFIENNKELILNPKNELKTELDTLDHNLTDDNLIFSINNVDNKNNLDISILEMGYVDKINFLPPNLNKLFYKNLNLIRTGVLTNIPDMNNNISFITSILSCLMSNFNMKSIDEQINYIKCIINLVYKNFNNNYAKYKLFKWKKENVLDNLNKLNINYQISYLYAEYFHINIFIIDLKEDKLYATNNNFISFKKNIFLIKINNNYEPIYFNDKKYLQYNSDIINTILENIENVNIFDNEENKFNIHIDNLDKYLNNKVKLDLKDKILLRKFTNNDRNNYEKDNNNIVKNNIKEINKNEENNNIKNIDSDINNFEEDNELVNVDKFDISETENYNIISETKNINNQNNNKKIFYEKLNDINTNQEIIDNIKNNKNLEIKENIKDNKNLEIKIKYNKKDLEQYKLEEIKNIAKKENINLKHKVDGKNKMKTKLQLIKEILNI